MKLHWRFIADGTVWTHLIIVSTLILAFSTRLVEAEEPIRIQTFRSDLPFSDSINALAIGFPGG